MLQTSNEANKKIHAFTRNGSLLLASNLNFMKIMTFLQKMMS